MKSPYKAIALAITVSVAQTRLMTIPYGLISETLKKKNAYERLLWAYFPMKHKFSPRASPSAQAARTHNPRDRARPASKGE